MPTTEHKNYTPPANLRFLISPDPFSMERFDAVRQTCVAMRGYPHFAGLTLFGSLAKGKNLEDPRIRNRTDVDLFCFLDGESLLTDTDYLYREEPLYARIAAFTEQDLDIALLNRTRLSSNQPLDQLPRPDKERIFIAVSLFEERVTKAMITHTQNPLNRPSHINVKCALIAREGLYSITDTVARADQSIQNRQWKVIWLLGIANLFGYDVDGGLSIYRRAFMEQLAALPPIDQERRWALVADTIAFWERNRRIPKTLEREFPTSFSAAQEYYV